MERAADNFSFALTESVKHLSTVNPQAVLEVGGATKGTGGGARAWVKLVQFPLEFSLTLLLKNKNWDPFFFKWVKVS